MMRRSALSLALTLVACTRPTESPPASHDVVRAITSDDASADSAATTAAQRRTIDAPVALALSAERSLVVVLKRQSPEPDEEIAPTLARMGLVARNPLEGNRASRRAATEIALTPEHRLVSISDGQAIATALPPATASLVILDTRALLALPADESAAARQLSRSQWINVDAPLQQLLRRQIGAGEQTASVQPGWITTSGPAPLAVFATCNEDQHPWGGPACAIVTADASSPVALTSEPSPITAARAANGVIGALRAHCPRATEVLRCPLEGLVLNDTSLTTTRLGWQSMQSVEGDSSDGWRSVAPWQDTVVAAWSSRDREQNARWSLRLARLDPRARRWIALPPIQCEGECRAHSFGGSPLTVLFSDDQPESGGALTVSTLGANNRWSASSVTPFEGRVVDAIIVQESDGVATTMLVDRGASGAALVRRSPSGETQTIALPNS